MPLRWTWQSRDLDGHPLDAEPHTVPSYLAGLAEVANQPEQERAPVSFIRGQRGLVRHVTFRVPVELSVEGEKTVGIACSWRDVDGRRRLRESHRLSVTPLKKLMTLGP